MNSPPTTKPLTIVRRSARDWIRCGQRARQAYEEHEQKILERIVGNHPTTLSGMLEQLERKKIDGK
jgi:hypothetical protein